MQNFLPLGIPTHLLSGGFVPLNSIAVGLEVAGAFLLVWTEFLDQALISTRGG
jgi:multisubunit Na+/H+ antiporter MnhB subunit